MRPARPAGEPPFQGRTAQAILARQLHDPSPPLRSRRANVPPAVEQAVMTALAKVPADRFSTASEFVEALETDGQSTTRRRPGRRSTRVLGTTTTVILAGMLATWGLWRVVDARTVKELMEKEPARFPTFNRLAEQGTFAPLEVVVPAESSVSWASLNSGQNPAKTGVPGFIKREIDEQKARVTPNFGFIRKDSAPLESFEHAPIPTWDQKTTAGLAGALTFLVVLLLAALLLRGKVLVAAALALLCGCAGAYAGWHVRGLLPASYPRTFNVVQTRSFWDYAADAGVPCVLLLQAWAEPARASYADDYEDGHHVVAVGHGEGVFFFRDPQVVELATLVDQDLLERWHSNGSPDTCLRNGAVPIQGPRPRAALAPRAMG